METIKNYLLAALAVVLAVVTLLYKRAESKAVEATLKALGEEEKDVQKSLEDNRARADEATAKLKDAIGRLRGGK